MNTIKKIIISRTDNLGDVLLTLPMAGYLKKQFPEAKIYFLGKSYTKPVIESSFFVDEFLDVKHLWANPEWLKTIQADVIFHVFPDKTIAKLAYQAKIPYRIGTSHRWWHWLYANKLVHFSRKKSDLHEAQLNFKLFQPLKIGTEINLSEIINLYGLQNKTLLPESVLSLLAKDKINFLLHPKSKGSAKEWGLENFYRLTQLLPQDKFQLFITGIEEEGALIRQHYPKIFENAIDLTGKLSLAELIALIDKTDGLIANSTGPLHIASALGKFTLGIFPSMRPTHSGRWKPIGKNANYLALEKECNDCKKKDVCACMQSIRPELTAKVITSFFVV